MEINTNKRYIEKALYTCCRFSLEAYHNLASPLRKAYGIFCFLLHFTFFPLSTKHARMHIINPHYVLENVKDGA